MDYMETLMQNLRRSKSALTEWSRAKYGATTTAIKKLSMRLNSLQKMEHPRNLTSILVRSKGN
jgi:hypothetical protein